MLKYRLRQLQKILYPYIIFLISFICLYMPKLKTKKEIHLFNVKHVLVVGFLFFFFTSQTKKSEVPRLSKRQRKHPLLLPPSLPPGQEGGSFVVQLLQVDFSKTRELLTIFLILRSKQYWKTFQGFLLQHDFFQ